MSYTDLPTLDELPDWALPGWGIGDALLGFRRETPAEREVFVDPLETARLVAANALRSAADAIGNRDALRPSDIVTMGWLLDRANAVEAGRVS
jgi:hypothetical protein